MIKFGMALAAALIVAPAFAAVTEVQLTLKDHKFSPAEIEAPKGQPFMIRVENQDTTAAEFESKQLRVEKVVPAGGKIVVSVRALKPGRYRFYDDYRENATFGFVVVK